MTTEDNVRFFKALGDGTRLRIIGYLMQKERCACDFTDLKDKDQTTVSRHLKVLTEAGIIKQERKGRNIICSIRDDSVRDRLQVMGVEQTDECCGVDGEGRKGPSSERIKDVVKKRYGKIATRGGSCGCSPGGCSSSDPSPMKISASLGYSEDELAEMPDSNLGLGCGNPGALGAIRKGDVVLDLGSGAGMDAFLAARRVGKNGKVIGVDLTKEMIAKAKRNARKGGFTNVEFRLGDIEDLPVESESIDVVLSNCVINLVPDKTKAFAQAYRVLKPGGSMYVSDMVLLKELTEEQKNDDDLIGGCVGGAALKDDYLATIKGAGFKLESVSDVKGIAKRQYRGLPVESLKVVARKASS